MFKIGDFVNLKEWYSEDTDILHYLLECKVDPSSVFNMNVLAVQYTEATWYTVNCSHNILHFKEEELEFSVQMPLEEIIAGML